MPASETARIVLPDGPMVSAEQPPKEGELAKRFKPPRQISLPNSLRSGLSRSKSMGIAVILIGLAAPSTSAGLSANAGATTRDRAAATIIKAVLRKTLADGNATRASSAYFAWRARRLGPRGRFGARQGPH